MTPLTFIVWLGIQADPSPAPTYPAYTGDPNLITPGVVGFIVTFAIAALTVLLLVDMTRRVRRVRYREEINAQLDAEEADRKVSPAPEG